MLRAYRVAALVVALFAASPAAAQIVDPAGDFLPSYTGPQNADVDLVSGNVAFDGTAFTFSERVTGTVGTTPGSLFVWAINRGSGVVRPALAPPGDGANILWDAVVVMFADGTLRVVNFPAAGAPAISTIQGGTSVANDLLFATVSASLLPSTGFNPANYTFSLWSRVRANPAVDGTNSEVADLLSGSGNLRAAVPEPGTWATMLLGFAALGVVVRRRSPRQVVA